MTKMFTYSYVLFYFLFSIGISANVHICKNKIRSISFYKTSTKSCCGKKKMKKGCCQNVNLVLKKTGSEKINTFSKAQIQEKLILPIFQLPIKKENHFSLIQFEKTTIYHPPPSINTSYTSIIIKNCSFLI